MGTFKAMKGNLVGTFTDHVWRLSNPEKHGWRKLGDKEAVKTIEIEQVEIEASVERKPIVETDIKPIVVTEIEDYPSDEEIREVLTDAGVKVHPKLGQKKLREKYHDFKKQ
jgi:hypothetical protein